MLSYVRIHQNYSDMQLDKGDKGKIFKEKNCVDRKFFGEQTKTSSIYRLFPEDEVSFIAIFFLIWKFSVGHLRSDAIFIGKLSNEEHFYRCTSG